MAGNTPTPSGETTTQPSAPVVPAAATPVAAVATPAVAPATPTPAATPAASTETPAPVAAVTPTPAKTNEPAPAAAPAVAVAAGPPEKYEFAPFEDGTKVSQGAIDAITPALKEAGVSQAAATKLITDFIKYQTGPLTVARNAADMETLRKDPELGLLNLGRTQATVNEALAAFTTPAERDELSKLGMVNNLTLVRMFARIGRAMGEAGATPSDPRPVVQKTTAQKLYGKTSGQAT